MATSDYGKVRSIFHDPDYYVKSFRAYSDLSSRLSVLKSWMQTVFPVEVVSKLPALAHGSYGSERPLRILGVGSGAGDTDCDMIGQLIKRYPSILNVAAEPASGHIEQYKRLVASLGLTGVKCDWQQQTLEEYRKYWETEGGRQKFHFISSVHSVYYMNDVERQIMNMYEMLEDGGSLMIIVLADDSGFGRVWRKFPMFSDDLQKHVLTDTLRDILTRNKVKYNVIRQPSRVDISCVFEKGNMQGNLVADFLAHVIDVGKTAPENVVNEFYEYLGGPECSTTENGEVLFNNSWDAVIARK